MDWGRHELLALLARWQVVKRRAESTVESYGYHLARMTRFGLVTVADVTPQRLSAYVVARFEGLTPLSMRAELLALFSLLSFLVRHERYPVELLRELRACIPSVKMPKRLSAPHLDRTSFDVLRAGSRSEDARFMIGVDTLSGLRAGELARLRWDDITLTSEPHLRVKIVPELGRAGTVKNGTERVVPVCAELKTIFLERQRRTGFVFSKGARFASVKTLRRELEIARQSAGLEWATFHVLRHTRASWWVQAGVPMAKVAKWLGHSLDICERYYAGLRDGYDPDCERMPAA